MVVLETITALPIFVASFLGSGHCIGMCGGFVAVYSQNARTRFAPHLFYNLGRLCTYLVLGTLAALVGQGIDAVSGVARLSSLIVALWLILFGIFALFRPGQQAFAGVKSNVSERFAKIAAPLFRIRGERLKPFFIGLVTTLLPCGWLYAFVALAAGAADVASALTIMTAFWLGSVPAMFGLGVASGALSGIAALRMPRITALLLIMSGLLSLSLHWAHSGHHHDHSSGHEAVRCSN